MTNAELEAAAAEVAKDRGNRGSVLQQNIEALSQNPSLAPVGAGVTSGVNSLLLGLPNYLAKTLDPEAYQKLLELQAQNKGAATAGDIAGAAASLLIPAGSIAKGAATGAKALKLGGVAKGLEAASDIIRGEKAASGIARGALTAAEQAVPRALTEAGTTGDVGEAIKHAAIGTALGGGLGAIAGKAAPKLAETAEEGATVAPEMGVKAKDYLAEIPKKLNDWTLSGLNITQRDLNKAIRLGETGETLGSTAGGALEDIIPAQLQRAYADPMKKAAADFVSTYKTFKPTKLKLFLDKADESGNDIVDLVKAASPGVADDVAQKTANLLQTVIGRQETAAASIGEIGKKLGAGLIGAQAVGGNPLGLAKQAISGELDLSDPETQRKLATTLLATGGTAAAIPRIAAVARKIPLGAAGAAGAAEAKAPGLLAKNAPTLEKAAGILPSAAAGTSTTPQEATASVQDKEATASPADVAQAKQQTLSTWQTRILQRLQLIYSTHVRNNEFPFEDFVSEVAKSTNNFDPKLTAQVMFPDEKERTDFLNTYDRALQLQSIDVNRALARPGLFNMSPETAKAHSDLQRLIGNLVSGGQEKIPGKDVRDEINKAISQIQKLNLSPEQKRAALETELQRSYGLDLDTLRRYGLYGA